MNHVPIFFLIELEGLLPLQNFIHKRMFRNYKRQALQEQRRRVVELRNKKRNEENKSDEAN